MLKEIYSSVIKQKTIKFHKGLNVVLGDNNASNSIGKSTMLLIPKIRNYHPIHD